MEILNKYIKLKAKEESINEERSNVKKLKKENKDVMKLSISLFSVFLFISLNSFMLFDTLSSMESLASAILPLTIYSIVLITTVVSLFMICSNIYKSNKNSSKLVFNESALLDEIKKIEQSVKDMSDKEIKQLLTASDSIPMLDYKYFNHMYEKIIKEKYKEFSEIDYLLENLKVQENNERIVNE